MKFGKLEANKVEYDSPERDDKKPIEKKAYLKAKKFQPIQHMIDVFVDAPKEPSTYGYGTTNKKPAGVAPKKVVQMKDSSVGSDLPFPQVESEVQTENPVARDQGCEPILPYVSHQPTQTEENHK